MRRTHENFFLKKTKKHELLTCYFYLLTLFVVPLHLENGK